MEEMAAVVYCLAGFILNLVFWLSKLWIWNSTVVMVYGGGILDLGWFKLRLGRVMM